jgi:nucleotide-binding universal stress UspA family protein
MKRILCPLDLRESVDLVLDYALGLAGLLDGRVDILHVYGGETRTVGVVVPAATEIEKHIRAERNQLLEALVARYADCGVELEGYLARGKPYRAIARMAKELGSDVIVMGTHDSSAVDYLFLGSNAERVVRTTKIPVFVVPQPRREGD